MIEAISGSICFNEFSISCRHVSVRHMLRLDEGQSHVLMGMGKGILCH